MRLKAYRFRALSMGACRPPAPPRWLWWWGWLPPHAPPLAFEEKALPLKKKNDWILCVECVGYQYFCFYCRGRSPLVLIVVPALSLPGRARLSLGCRPAWGENSCPRFAPFPRPGRVLRRVSARLLPRVGLRPLPVNVLAPPALSLRSGLPSRKFNLIIVRPRCLSETAWIRYRRL